MTKVKKNEIKPGRKAKNILKKEQMLPHVYNAIRKIGENFNGELSICVKVQSPKDWENVFKQAGQKSASSIKKYAISARSHATTQLDVRHDIYDLLIENNWDHSHAMDFLLRSRKDDFSKIECFFHEYYLEKRRFLDEDLVNDLKKPGKPVYFGTIDQIMVKKTENMVS